ncbi:hypothetical protein [Treponema sp.]|uniref:hypothetical protein n=1 Tax=Treponema sp. TaxID=166 RepID=UPI003FD82A5C
MKTKYREIIKLKEMLEMANIPFCFSGLLNGYHIVYRDKGDEFICAVIEHDYSYGHEKDLLEIMGLVTKKEERKTQDNVLGYLTANNVYQRIKKHYLKERKNE